MKLIDPLVKLWRDKVWGPRLRTYGEAREELGGLPWRKFTNTERWFLPSPRSLPPPIPMGTGTTGAITLDTGAIMLSKPGLGELLRKRTTWMIAGGASLLVVTALIVSPGSKASAAVAAMPVPAPAASAPAEAALIVPPGSKASAPIVASAPTVLRATAPSVAPRSAPKMSASVRALLAGKSTRGVARPTRLKKVRRR